MAETNEKRWFAVHTYSGYEERVKKNLEQRIRFMDTLGDIARVEIPEEKEVEVRSGQQVTHHIAVLTGSTVCTGVVELHGQAFAGDDILARIADLIGPG